MKKNILILIFIFLSIFAYSQTLPTVADNTVSTNEDTDKIFAEAEFNYFDADGDPFTTLETTTVPGSGTLWVDTDGDGTVNGAEVPLAAGNTAAVIDITSSRLKFKPVADENGIPYTTFTFRVHDGNDGWSLLPASTMTIDVTSVNDEPSFTAGANQNVNEDPGAQTVVGWATAISKGPANEAGQILIFHLSNDNNGLFSVQPDVDEITGDLTYTPAADANGVANVTIWITDDGGTANGGDDTSPSQFFSVTVNAVNDPPVGAANTVSCFENSYLTFVSGHFGYSDVERDPFTQIETTTVPGAGTLWIDTDLSGTINGAEVPLAAGNSVTVADINLNRLKFLPVADENGTPYTTFNFKVHDGTEYSTLSYLMTVDVNSINSEPSFTAGPDQNINEDAGAQNIPAWATAIDKGAPDEAGQVLTFHLSNDNNPLFSVQPDVDELTGNLTYTSAPDAYGVANVDIYLTDDGGTANGGDDTSPTQNFTIIVNSVNDDPVIVNNTGKTVLEGALNQVILNSELQVTDVDNIPLEITYTVSTVPSSGTLYLNVTPLAVNDTYTQADIDASLLNYSHDGSENITDLFRFTVSDGAGGNIGVTQFDITITPVNDDPVFTSIPITTGDEGILYTYNITTTDSDLPPDVLVLSVPTKPAWLILTDNGDGTGDLSGIPPHGCARNNAIVLEVFDGTATIQQSYSLIVSLNILIDGGGGGDYLTIQGGIDAAINGDIVSVLNGTYIENIDFNGKDIQVIGNEADPSQVIIDGGSSGTCVTFENGEPLTAVISGFTVTNGIGRLGLPSTFSLHAPGGAYYGGGIFCYQSDPTLQNLFVLFNSVAYESNHGGSGAGIYIGNNSNVTIEGTVSTVRIENNTTNTYRGGGICIDNSVVIINNVDIQNNSGGNYGGGIAVYNSTLDLINVNILNNTVNGPNGRGGGLYDHTSAVNIVGGSIIGNSASTGGNNRYSFY